MNFKKHFLSLFSIAIFLLISTVAYGQGDVPCDPDDPACNAPLDTWVIFFAAIVLIITVRHLRRQQKADIGKTLLA